MMKHEKEGHFFPSSLLKKRQEGC